jgi:hypothetical protein
MTLHLKLLCHMKEVEEVVDLVTCLLSKKIHHLRLVVIPLNCS